MKTRIAVAFLMVLGLAQSAFVQEALWVTFVVNDATVKDRLLAGVKVTVAHAAGGEAVLTGTTGADGRFVCSLPLGTYSVSYALPGYVLIGDSPTEVAADGQVVTTALSMMLEAEGATGSRRIRVILNWGSDPSQVRDADSHLLCPCGDTTAHVFFSNKEHAAADHRVDLDVDDTDWGGPETVTLHDPPPGTYRYWVHDYSGPPALLASSAVVVRVLFGDTVAGEYRVSPAATDRVWLPFASLEVGPDLVPRIVPFSPDELAAGADRVVPAGCEVAGQNASPEAGGDAGSATRLALGVAMIFLLLALTMAGRALRRLRR